MVDNRNLCELQKATGSTYSAKYYCVIPKYGGPDISRGNEPDMIVLVAKVARMWVILDGFRNYCALHSVNNSYFRIGILSTDVTHRETYVKLS